MNVKNNFLLERHLNFTWAKMFNITVNLHDQVAFLIQLLKWLSVRLIKNWVRKEEG